MDVSFFQGIVENDFKLPPGHTAAELTPQLVANLGSTQSDLREISYLVLCGLTDADPGVNYSAEQLSGIGKQMTENLTYGVGDEESDSVFVRAFSILVLAQVIAVDGATPYLPESEVRDWLEQGVRYFGAEKDLRGYVPGKGWAHAIAHAADFFRVITQNRYLNADDLKRILNAIADKVTEPVVHTYLYQEDDRLAQAVVSALLGDTLDMAFLNAWLERLVHPPSGIVWRKAFSDAACTNARFNTITFLRSLYFQLLLGTRYVHDTYAGKTPAVKEELLQAVTGALKAIDHWVYAC